MRANWMATLGAVLTLAACATVTRGTSEHVEFISEPPSATMTSLIEPPCANGCSGRREIDMVENAPPKIGPSCVTPCGLEVPRAEVWLLTFRKDGYADATVRLGTQVAGKGAAGVAGNAIIGGAAGAFTDMATGAMNDHSPNPVRVTLTPLPKH